MRDLYPFIFAFACVAVPTLLLWIHMEWQADALKKMNEGLTTAEIFRKAGENK